MWTASILAVSTLLSFQSIDEKTPVQIVQEHQNERLRIRGFIYHTAKGEWILADEPNLKSCCVGSSRNASRQIFLDNIQLDKETLNVQEVEGMLALNEDGRMHLHNASIIEAASVQNYWVYFGVFIAIGAVILVAANLMRKRL